MTLSTFTFLHGRVYYAFCPHSNYTHFLLHPIKISPYSCQLWGLAWPSWKHFSQPGCCFMDAGCERKTFITHSSQQEQKQQVYISSLAPKSQRVTQKGPGGPQGGSRRQMQWVSCHSCGTLSLGNPPCLHPAAPPLEGEWFHPFRLLAENTTPGNGLGMTSQDQFSWYIWQNRTGGLFFPQHPSFPFREKLW